MEHRSKPAALTGRNILKRPHTPGFDKCSVGTETSPDKRKPTREVSQESRNEFRFQVKGLRV